MEYLYELDLTNCSILKSFPGISTNIRCLILTGTAIKRIPSSIKLWPRLDELHMARCEKLEQLDFGCSLRTMDLTGCSSLVELSMSVEKVIDLWSLNLSDCSSLVKLPQSIGNATNLHFLYLRGCSSLMELPASIGNITSLETLDLTGCSSLLELTSSIENATTLQYLYLCGCSSLMELPSLIGNVTILLELDLSDCSGLMELPSSIGNVTNLEKLDLSGCLSLMQLPSSIGNLQNLWRFRLRGCSKLEALPINIDMKALGKLDLTDCCLLKSFPEISTNIRSLILTGTAIEDIPSSIKLWSHLDKLHISYWENLGEFSHAFHYITKMSLSDTRIQEISPWIKELPRLRKLLVKGCTKLVSLPQLPDSLESLWVENCDALERLDCSLQFKNLVGFGFVNCFKLNQEARDHIINKALSCEDALLPGEKVPTYFTCRATGSCLTIKLDGMDIHFPTYVRFKACFLLVNKDDVEVDWNMLEISHCITEKGNGISVTCRYENVINLSPQMKKHLFVTEFEEEVSSSDLVFEFDINVEGLEIAECGIRTL